MEEKEGGGSSCQVTGLFTVAAGEQFGRLTTHSLTWMWVGVESALPNNYNPI